MITTIKASLFDAPKGAIIIHACNTKGVWGSGIAAEFAKRFPAAERIYKEHCAKYEDNNLGKSLLIPTQDHMIGCLFTSNFKNSPDEIVAYTRAAIHNLITKNLANKPLHTCKINSGIFNVPWEKSLAALESTGKDFVVYEI